MIDISRSMHVTSATNPRRNGPVRLITRDGTDVIVRLRNGEVAAFSIATGYSDRYASTIRLENEPIRTTTRFYARKSASRPSEIKLQQTRPVSSIGEIEVDIENDKIVAVRLA